MSDVKYNLTAIEIKNEIYKAFENLGQSYKLLGIIGSWMDTLDDEDILAMLIDWNRGENSISEIKRA